MSKRKLYFSCALSGLPQEHRARMIALRDSLKDHFDVLEFCDPKQSSNKEIYNHDIHYCVATADLMLAVVDERGTGLGFEMGVMVEKHGKPVLAVAHLTAVVSPFVLGIDHPRYRFAPYASTTSILRLLLDFERDMFPEE